MLNARFLEVFAKRNIASERVINFQDLDWFAFTDLMRGMDWLPYAKLNVTQYPWLVRTFYTYASPIQGQLGLEGKIKGIDFCFGVPELNVIFSVLSKGQ